MSLHLCYIGGSVYKDKATLSKRPAKQGSTEERHSFLASKVKKLLLLFLVFLKCFWLAVCCYAYVILDNPLPYSRTL